MLSHVYHLAFITLHCFEGTCESVREKHVLLNVHTKVVIENILDFISGAKLHFIATKMF